ncbi:futalosine hydrolase [Streptomyces sp. NPDC005438]|uniref:futalosine hydrolase n=1 Tax=Streptomyces sp. NPDC005438 TaxID=3156880 RepID=UPI0033A9CCEF
MRVLAVTAVVPERDAFLAGRDTTVHPLPGGYELRRAALPGGRVDVLAGGVGPAASAAATATALTVAELDGHPYDVVLSAGIGGSFPGVGPAGCVVAESVVAADLGAESPEGFTPVTGLGFGVDRVDCPADLVRSVVAAVGGVPGEVLTVSTVTGTRERAEQLSRRHPRARAEAMEGFGVASAALGHRVPVLELRTISNEVGPRNRDAWDIPGALAALGRAAEALVPLWEGEERT